MRRYKSKGEAECQTVLHCSPLDVKEGESVNVESEQITQTVASAPPYVTDIEFYPQLMRVDPELIRKDALQIIKYRHNRHLQFTLPADSSEDIESPEMMDTLDTFLDESSTRNSSIIFISDENIQDKQCQTRLMVFPHFLKSAEKAAVSSNVRIQTSVTCNPRCSLSEIIPKLKSYLQHDTQEMVSGDSSRNVSLLEIIRGIIEDVEASHKHLFDENYVPPAVPSSFTRSPKHVPKDTIALKRAHQKEEILKVENLSEGSSIEDIMFAKSSDVDDSDLAVLLQEEVVKTPRNSFSDDTDFIPIKYPINKVDSLIEEKSTDDAEVSSAEEKSAEDPLKSPIDAEDSPIGEKPPADVAVSSKEERSTDDAEVSSAEEKSTYDTEVYSEEEKFAEEKSPVDVAMSSIEENYPVDVAVSSAEDKSAEDALKSPTNAVDYSIEEKSPADVTVFSIEEKSTDDAEVSSAEEKSTDDTEVSSEEEKSVVVSVKSPTGAEDSSIEEKSPADVAVSSAEEKSVEDAVKSPRDVDSSIEEKSPADITVFSIEEKSTDDAEVSSAEEKSTDDTEVSSEDEKSTDDAEVSSTEETSTDDAEISSLEEKSVKDAELFSAEKKPIDEAAVSSAYEKSVVDVVDSLTKEKSAGDAAVPPSEVSLSCKTSKVEGKEDAEKQEQLEQNEEDTPANKDISEGKCNDCICSGVKIKLFINNVGLTTEQDPSKKTCLELNVLPGLQRIEVKDITNKEKEQAKVDEDRCDTVCCTNARKITCPALNDESVKNEICNYNSEGGEEEEEEEVLYVMVSIDKEQTAENEYDFDSKTEATETDSNVTTATDTLTIDSELTEPNDNTISEATLVLDKIEPDKAESVKVETEKKVNEIECICGNKEKDGTINKSTEETVDPKENEETVEENNNEETTSEKENKEAIDEKKNEEVAEETIDDPKSEKTVASEQNDDSSNDVSKVSTKKSEEISNLESELEDETDEQVSEISENEFEQKKIVDLESENVKSPIQPLKEIEQKKFVDFESENVKSPIQPIKEIEQKKIVDLESENVKSPIQPLKEFEQKKIVDLENKKKEPPVQPLDVRKRNIFCEKKIIKETRSRELLKSRAMSISNLKDGTIQTVISKSTEGFNVIINITNPNQDACVDKSDTKPVENENNKKINEENKSEENKTNENKIHEDKNYKKYENILPSQTKTEPCICPSTPKTYPCKCNSNIQRPVCQCDINKPEFLPANMPELELKTENFKTNQQIGSDDEYETCSEGPSTSRSKKGPDIMQLRQEKDPPNVPCPTTNAQLKLPDNTVLNLRLTLDMKNYEHICTCNKKAPTKKRSVKEMSSYQASLASTTTGVLPYRTQKLYDVHKGSQQTLASNAFLKTVNSYLFSESSRTINILTPGMLSQTSYDSYNITGQAVHPTVSIIKHSDKKMIDKKISFRRTIQYDSASNINQTSELISQKNVLEITSSQSEPVILTQTAPEENYCTKNTCESLNSQRKPCSCTANTTYSTSNRTCTSKPVTPKSASDIFQEKQDIVFMAFKACEEEFKPVKKALTNLKKELRSLNMPEVDCIFNKLEVVNDIPKMSFFQQKIKELNKPPQLGNLFCKISQSSTLTSKSKGKFVDSPEIGNKMGSPGIISRIKIKLPQPFSSKSTCGSTSSVSRNQQTTIPEFDSIYSGSLNKNISNLKCDTPSSGYRTNNAKSKIPLRIKVKYPQSSNSGTNQNYSSVCQSFLTSRTDSSCKVKKSGKNKNKVCDYNGTEKKSKSTSTTKMGEKNNKTNKICKPVSCSYRNTSFDYNKSIPTSPKQNKSSCNFIWPNSPESNFHYNTLNSQPVRVTTKFISPNPQRKPSRSNQNIDCGNRTQFYHEISKSKPLSKVRIQIPQKKPQNYDSAYNSYYTRDNASSTSSQKPNHNLCCSSFRHNYPSQISSVKMNVNNTEIKNTPSKTMRTKLRIKSSQSLTPNLSCDDSSVSSRSVGSYVSSEEFVCPCSHTVSKHREKRGKKRKHKSNTSCGSSNVSICPFMESMKSVILVDQKCHKKEKKCIDSSKIKHLKFQMDFSPRKN